MSDSIDVKCPQCHTEFPLSEGVLSSVREGFQGELQKSLRAQEQQFAEQKKALEEQAKIKATEASALELKAIRQELEEKAKALQTSQEQELTLRKRERQLEEQRQALALDVEKQVSTRLAEESKNIESRAELKATERAATELKQAKQELDEKNEALKLAREAQTELLKKERELKEQAEKIGLENAQKLNKERDKIRSEALAQADETHRLKMAELEKKLNDAAKAKDELSRKLEQGSQQTQGEVLELEFENRLRQSFPIDQFEEVPKGVRGADIIHRILNPTGQASGSIVYEIKQTKSWSRDWVPKLKDDLAKVKGDVAVLITATLPEGVENFALVDGIWVSSITHALPLVHTLRWSLIELARAKAASAGMEDNKSLIYNYFTGPEFRNRLETIVNTFTAMRTTLEQEKRALSKHWSAREKQIDKVVLHLTGMQGDIQGIAHSEIEALDFSLDDE